MTIPVVSFVGRSNTGKTTLIAKLIPILKARGVRVATIKHHHGDFEVDREGKDTYRHKSAGARLSMIVSPTKLALVKDLDDEPGLATVLDQYVTDVDLVIVEGYKKEKIPKVEVYNTRSGAAPVTFGDENLLAIVADGPFSSQLRVFLRDDLEEIVNFLVETFALS